LDQQQWEASISRCIMTVMKSQTATDTIEVGDTGVTMALKFMTNSIRGDDCSLQRRGKITSHH
jgi:hypothetical protein